MVKFKIFPRKSDTHFGDHFRIIFNMEEMEDNLLERRTNRAKKNKQIKIEYIDQYKIDHT